jgi:Sap, sulfolipid-1-addressing protein
MSVELRVLVLSLEAALYPTLLAAVIILLAQPRPRRMLAAYLGAGLFTSITAGCLIVFALGGAVHSSSSTVSWGADLAVGGLLLLVAVTLATRADVRWRERRRARRGRPARKEAKEDREPWSERILARGSVPLVILAGLVINVPGAAYLIGLKDIAAAHLTVGRSFLLILQFNLIMFLLAEIPLVGLIVAPERTGELVQRFNTWLTNHSRQIAILVCLLIAAFLIARGIANS